MSERQGRYTEIDLDRKILANLAAIFAAVIEKAKNALKVSKT